MPVEGKTVSFSSKSFIHAGYILVHRAVKVNHAGFSGNMFQILINEVKHGFALRFGVVAAGKPEAVVIHIFHHQCSGD